ncbi:MAG: ATP-dependent zinc metalloprotease FtsH, partial [Oscillospiraceae bacterium]|nr:ATP-dependent zinc metalloprotease FtsH [Oscillospiraceae bacterium]
MGKNRGLLTYVIIALLFIIAIWVLMPSLASNQHATKYSDIMAHFDSFEVTEYTLDLGSGELKYKLTDDPKTHTYEVPNVSLFLQDTEKYREQYNARHKGNELTQDYFKVTDNSWLLTVV